MSELRLISVLVDNAKSFNDFKVKELLLKCIRDDTTRISATCTAFERSHYEILLAVVIKKIGYGKEEWKVSGMREEKDKYVIITKKSEEEKVFPFTEGNSDEKEKAFKKTEEEFTKKIHDFHYEVTDIGFDSIFKALTAVDIIDKEDLEKMPKFLIDIGVNRTFFTRAPVDRLISTVSKYITDGNKLNFKDNELMNFTNVMEGIDFIPLTSAESDVRLKVFEILRTLKVNNFADFNENVLNRIKKFIKENRKSFVDDVTQISELLRKDPRGKNWDLSLTLSCQQRIDFLYGIGLFDPGQVIQADLPEVLYIINSTGALSKLIDERQSLNKTIKRLKAMEFSEAYTSAVNRLDLLKKEINYNIVLEYSKAPLKAQDFFITFAKATKDRTFTYVKETTEEILKYVDKAQLDEEESLSILSILSSCTNQEFNDIPENILDTIVHNQHHLDIIKFGNLKNLTKPINFCAFMMKIFIVNEDMAIYVPVLNACRKYFGKLDNQKKMIVDIEEQIITIETYQDIKKPKRDTVLNILNSIGGLIEDDQLITINMFRFFLSMLNYNEVCAMLEKVVRKNIQKLPKFLLNELGKKLNDKNVSVTVYSLDLIELLVKRNLLQCLTIKTFLIDAIKSQRKENSNKALLVIYAGIHCGQKIPNDIILAVRNLKLQKGIHNIIKMIIDPTSKFLILIDSKITYAEKKKTMKEIQESDWSDELAKILIDLIIYDKKLKLSALKTLLRIVPPEFNLNRNINVMQVIFNVLNSNLDYETLQQLLIKTKTNLADVISSLDSYNRKKLQEVIFKVQNETEFTHVDIDNVKELIEVINKKINVKDWVTYSEFSMLLSGLKNESLKESFNEISKTFKTIFDHQGFETSCYEIFLNFLLINKNHQNVNELLKLLNDSDQKIMENIKTDASKQLNAMVDLLKTDFGNRKALKVIILLSKDLSPQSITKLKEFCFIDNIDLKVQLKFIEIIASHTDQNFTDKILEHVLKKIDWQMRKTIKNVEYSLRYPLALAVGYANAHDVYLKSDILARNEKYWAFDILSQVLFSLIEFEHDSDLKLIIDSLDFFRYNYNGENNKPNIAIEDMLMKLLDKLNGERVAAGFLNDIITMLISRKEVYELFSEEVESWKNINALRRFWLSEELNIKFTKLDDINSLMIMLDYPLSILISIIKNISMSVDIFDIQKIFDLLKESLMPYEEKVQILSELQGYPCHQWLQNVESYIVHRVFLTSLKYFEDSEEEHKNLSFELQKLCHVGWSEAGMIKLIEKINSKEDMVKILIPIRLLYEFQIKEIPQNLQDESVFEILRKNSWESVGKKIYDLAIKNSFAGTNEKTAKVLLEEIHDLNTETNINYLLTSSLKEDFDKVCETYEKGASAILKNSKTINIWDVTDLMTWANILKNNYAEMTKVVTLYEQIAVTMRGIKIFKGYKPRDIQILSLLLLLTPQKRNGSMLGRLTQINTGEGKTTIVAMLAVIKGLAGHNVDVVTSSPELAKPQSQEMGDYYKMFELSASHNGEDKVDKNMRYKCNIVYGAASDFQADILREEYSKESIKSGRKTDLVIVDEADSMLLDGRNYMVMLSSQMPSMNFLEPLLATIWTNIGQFDAHIKKEKDQYYYIHPKGQADENGEITDKDGTGYKIELNEFIKKNLLASLKDMIEGKGVNVDLDTPPEAVSTSTEPPIKVPTHLKKFILDHQLDKWLDSAIYAKYFSSEGRNYILNEKGKIVPVDSENTGVLQKSMNWSNGLHQFLQLKHGCQITAESITTNFISNVSYFKRYGTNIFGMTGTLGSNRSKHFLEKTYNVDSIVIPPFKVKRYKELSAVITKTDEEWYDEIVKTNLRHLNQNRAVLIITKYIEEAEELEKKFKAVHKKGDVRLYAKDEHSKVVKTEVNSGDLIIATNIAGRGTDIKTTPNVEEFGGLHVCVTFLPPNERVEHQNVGRTARTGNLGTGQFIIKEKRIFIIEKLKMYRNFMEEQEIDKAEQEITVTLNKDLVFKKFCDLLIYAKNEFQRKAIEERFGIWLQINSEKSKNLMMDFREFKKEIKDDLKNDVVIKNACYYVQCGDKYLKHREFSHAIKNFDKAISIEPEFCENAYYNRGYAKLQKYKEDITKNKAEVLNACEDFRQALKRVKNRENELNILMLVKSKRNNELNHQIIRKFTLYSIQKNVIKEVVGIDQEEYDQILKSFELGEKEELKKFNEAVKENPNNKNESQKIYDAATNDLNEKRKNFEESNPKKGVIDRAFEKGNNIKIESFNIRESFPDSENVKLFDDEIEEFRINGFIGKFVVSEDPPINWVAFFGVFSFGLAQAIAGGLLVVFSGGTLATLGAALLSEGTSDMIYAVKSCLINRDFSLKDYAINKAISLSVTVLTLGVGALKTAAAGASIAVNQLSKPLLKEGLKLAVKKIATEVFKTAIKEIGKQIINKIVDLTAVDLLKKLIKEALLPEVKKWLHDIAIIARMLVLDCKRRNHFFKTKIINGITKIIENERNMGSFEKAAFKKGKELIEKFGVNKHFLSVSKMILDIIDILMNTKTKLMEFLTQDYEEMILKLEQAQDEVENEEESKEKQALIKPLDNVEESYDSAVDNVSTKVTVKITTMVTENIIRPLTDYAIDKSVEALDKYGKLLDEKIENYKVANGIIKFDNTVNLEDPVAIKAKLKAMEEDQKKMLEEIEKRREELKESYENFKNGETKIEMVEGISHSIARNIILKNANNLVIAAFYAMKEGAEAPLEVQYHEPTENSEGYFTTTDGHIPENKYNDSFFNIIAEQTKISDINEVKEKTVELHKRTLEIEVVRQVDEQRLKMYKPFEKPQKSFARSNDIDPTYMAGSFKFLQKQLQRLKGTSGHVVLYHMPPKNILVGVNESDLPSIAMLDSDYKSKTSGQAYEDSLKVILKSNTPTDFTNLTIVEFTDLHLLTLANRSWNYKETMERFIKHCKSEKRIDNIGTNKLYALINNFPTPKNSSKDELKECIKKLESNTMKIIKNFSDDRLVEIMENKFKGATKQVENQKEVNLEGIKPLEIRWKRVRPHGFES